MAKQPDQELEVTVERVMYPPETTKEADWFILKTSEGTCKGNMGWRPRDGERLTLIGKNEEYQGQRQFKFKSAALNLPTDPRGMLHYVCEIASGIGAAMEAQIWEVKGEQWGDIKEGDLPRLKGRVYDSFIQAIERCEADREKGGAISQLLEAGCSMNMAAAAYDKWGKSTLGVVSHDPYRLAELKSFGFQNVDGEIRLHFGIEDNDPRRIRAAVVYVLRQLTSNGSTLVPWGKLNGSCLNKLGGFQELILQSVSEMFTDGTLKGFHGSGNIALASDFFNESQIWSYISTEDAA